MSLKPRRKYAIPIKRQPRRRAAVSRLPSSSALPEKSKAWLRVYILTPKTTPSPRTRNLIRQRPVPTAERRVLSRFIKISTDPRRSIAFSTLAGKGEAKPEGRISFAVGQDMNQLRAKRDRERDGQEGSEKTKHAPFAKECSVFPPRIGHAKAKPDAGKQRLRQEQDFASSPILSVELASSEIACSTLSAAKISIPTAKNQLAAFCRLRKGAINARATQREAAAAVRQKVKSIRPSLWPRWNVRSRFSGSDASTLRVRQVEGPFGIWEIRTYREVAGQTGNLLPRLTPRGAHLLRRFDSPPIEASLRSPSDGQRVSIGEPRVASGHGRRFTRQDVTILRLAARHSDERSCWPTIGAHFLALSAYELL